MNAFIAAKETENAMIKNVEKITLQRTGIALLGNTDE